jgi:hypothetical protein
MPHSPQLRLSMSVYVQTLPVMDCASGQHFCSFWQQVASFFALSLLLSMMQNLARSLHLPHLILQKSRAFLSRN